MVAPKKQIPLPKMNCPSLCGQHKKPPMQAIFRFRRRAQKKRYLLNPSRKYVKCVYLQASSYMILYGNTGNGIHFVFIHDILSGW